MSEAFWIALLVGVGSPLLLALMTNWNKSRERQEDRAERAEIAKRAEVAALALTENLKLVERNTNSMTTTIERLARKEGSVEGERRGEQRGADKAATLLEGQRQGAENERASAQANASAGGPISPAVEPVAVKDEVTAAAVKRVGDVIEAASEATKKP